MESSSSSEIQNVDAYCDDIKLKLKIIKLTERIKALEKGKESSLKEIQGLKLKNEKLSCEIVEVRRQYEDYANLDDETKEILRMIISTRGEELDAEGFAKFLEGFPDNKVTNLDDVKRILGKYLKLIYQQNCNAREQTLKIISLNEQIKRLNETCKAYEFKLAEKKREFNETTRDYHKVKEEYDLLYTLCETLNTKLLSYDDTKRREYHNTLRNLNNEISYTLSTAYEMVENCINFICRATDRKIPILNKMRLNELNQASSHEETESSIFDDTFLKKEINVFRLLRKDLIHISSDLGFLNLRDVE